MFRGHVCESSWVGLLLDRRQALPNRSKLTRLWLDFWGTLVIAI